MMQLTDYHPRIPKNERKNNHYLIKQNNMVLSESYSLHCEGRLGTDEEGSLWDCVPEDDDPLESTSSLLYFSV